jgi:hypothetical protein
MDDLIMWWGDALEKYAELTERPKVQSFGE